MSRTSHASTLFFVLLIIATACSELNLSKKEAAFTQLIQVEEMNTKIKFWKLKRTETYKIGDSVHLTLENLSEYKIKFPGDFGVRIFRYDEDNDTWIEIKNGMIYIPPGSTTQVSPKGPDLPGVIGIGLWPILQNEGQPIDIRVVVVGSVERDNVLTDEQVGAYIDLTLLP